MLSVIEEASRTWLRATGLRCVRRGSLSQDRAASGRGRIDRQRNLLADYRLQTVDGATLIAAARCRRRRPADHLPVDYGRDAARDREEIKKGGRTRQAVPIRS
jgi:hypothetical protein